MKLKEYFFRLWCILLLGGMMKMSVAQEVQNLDHFFIGSFGFYGQSDSFQLSGSLGEVAVRTYQSSQSAFTQGFQQPENETEQIPVPPECKEIYNVITPFGSPGANDRWDIGPIAAYSQVSIFDRWGREVFSAQPYLNDWAGQRNDLKVVEAGTYYYLITFDEGKACRGTITILK